MTARRRVAGAVGGALGVAAAGTAVGILRQQRAISRRAGETHRVRRAALDSR